MLEYHQRDLPYINQITGCERKRHSDSRKALLSPTLLSPTEGRVITLGTTTKINFDPKAIDAVAKARNHLFLTESIFYIVTWF
jgi:hypothetical protein